MKYFLLLCVTALVFTSTALTETPYWQDVSKESIVPKGERYILASAFRTVYLNKYEFFGVINSIPKEADVKVRNSNSIFSFPMPNGTMSRFKVVESPVMEPGLAIQYPEIKTYLGQGIDDPFATVRFDYTPLGFHAMILSPNGIVFIDPYSMNETEYYISYYKSDFFPAIDPKFVCHVDENSEAEVFTPRITGSRTGEQLRTYRIAIATTVEYTNVCGGLAGTVANINTTLNRITGVYEQDLAVRLTLIANNNTIIYTTAPDPYTNNNGSTLLTENQNNLTAVIGSANYDIGHVFSTGTFGGIAGLRVVCISSQKARGATGSTNPVGDPWAIDYVAHEMGHQFGGNHTQNNSNCNANPPTAWEPGSAITIMGYAGVCAPNLANNSIPYFHGGNMFQEMIPYTVSGNGALCPVTTNTGNSPPAPTVPAGGFTIPISTYFSLTGSATDPNNDPMTYSWEEMDTGPQGNPSNPSGNAPLFRPFPPATNGTRIFPKLSDQLNNTQTLGELLPTYTRNLNFRMTVRDNRAGGGGVAFGDIAFNVSNTSGPFLVTFPNTNVSIGGNQTILWNVANTTAAPVSCANVKISLSTDGGNTWPTVLAPSTPNDGTQQVTLPDISNTTARIKIESVGNIFYDISNANFTVTPHVGIQNQTGTPIVFGLSQNFPNPFNPVTIVNYGIPKTSNVTLKIYDVSGRLVSTLIDNLLQTEGYYNIEFNASSFASGVYYYSITAGKFSDTKKMLLIK
ncbi:MAG: T9SS type A sorting domain-containing protein [Ignavibacteria bacterium]|nr:T9SS type A sorting domain-containing protein [Ignavibacteria bacterium]